MSENMYESGNSIVPASSVSPKKLTNLVDAIFDIISTATNAAVISGKYELF
jgi:hypothetical protein